MNFINNGANIKQFQLIRFVNENCIDDHVMSKISIVLRRDKIEAPYYMDTNIKLSYCVDMPENGIIHAMDMLNHNRRHNLTEEKFNEIKELILEVSDDELDRVKISKDDMKLKMVLMSRNDEDFRNLFKDYGEVFEKIDNLVD